MCMEQFYKLIGSCRLPNRTKDDFRIFQTNTLDISRTNHITIMYKNRVRQRHLKQILITKKTFSKGHEFFISFSRFWKSIELIFILSYNSSRQNF